LQTTGLLVILLLSITSCQNERETAITKYDNSQNLHRSPETGRGSEGNMELAEPTPNPYTVSNMLLALSELQNQSEIEFDASIFTVRVTHKYIRFEPRDSVDLGRMLEDTSLLLFDYPLDRKIVRGGTYYRDPTLSDSQPNYQWTCVEANRVLPSNIPYTILSDLYLPEEDPNLIALRETPQDEYVTALVYQALVRTGNFDTTDNYDGVTNRRTSNSLRLGLPSKWNPQGRIRLFDNVVNNTLGLQGIKVRANRWFETREGLTDGNGNFFIAHQFRFPVNYSIKWERNDFQIRSGSFGQAIFNGPKLRGNWNLDITNGLSWHYGHIHRACFDYYYNNFTGLRQPPPKGFLGMRLTIGLYDDCDRAGFNRSRRNWITPEIKMYNKSTNCTNRTALDQYSTAIHELAHASHFNISNWHYRNCKVMVLESYALGVEWSFARVKYSTSAVRNYQNLRLQNAPVDPNGVRFDIVNWGERKYTPLVIDLIDNYNQRTNNGGNIDFPVDNVANYTIRTVEDALVNAITMNIWRDQLKTDKPSGVTDAQLDELFLNYTPLQGND
jgi:hypothetical protein